MDADRHRRPDAAADQGGIQSIVFNSPTDIVVALSGAAPAGIFYSSDGGDHWDKASGMPVSEGVYYITRGLTGSPLPIYAAASDGVFTSIDQGRSWTLTSDGIPPSESPKRIAVDPANPRHLFASTTSGVYRSYSGGATWVPAMGGTLPGAGNKDAILLAPSLGGQFGPGHAVVGTEQGAFATVDNGDTWARCRWTPGAVQPVRHADRDVAGPRLQPAEPDGGHARLRRLLAAVTPVDDRPRSRCSRTPR